MQAGLSRVITEAAAVLRRLERRDRQIAAALGELEKLAAEYPDAELLAAAADKLANRLSLSVIERISLAAHHAESREAAERLASVAAFSAVMKQAAYLEGRRDEAAERDEAAARAPRSHRAPRGRHLRLAGPAVKAGIVAAAATVATTTIVMHDSASSVTYAASGPAHHSALHLSAPDPSATPLRPSWSPPARPSVAVKSASPAPSVTPSPAAPAPDPSPSSSAPPATPSLDPALDVSASTLDLGDITKGTFTLSAEDRTVQWTASTSDGVHLSQDGGVLVPGQPLTLDVFAPQGHGVIYIRWGSRSIVTVDVTSSLAGLTAGL